MKTSSTSRSFVLRSRDAIVSTCQPFGATGARLVTQLANEMTRRNVQFGLISICAQGGMGMAMILERA